MTRMAAFIAAAIALVAASDAGAALWAYGCRGAFGTEQIVFNRYSLVVLSGQQPKLKLGDLIHGDTLIAEGDTATPLYDADDANTGFEKTLPYSRHGKPSEKLTLTELKSRTLSERNGRIG